MYVKLSTELSKQLSCKEDVITWTELKEKLKSVATDNSEVIGLLKGSKFLAQRIKIQKEKTLTSEEYAKLISSSSPPCSTDIHKEIVQLRSDVAELRKETTWLVNCLFSVLGTGGFVYFVVSFYFDKVENRLVCSLISGLVLFFIEVLLYIIRY